MRKPAYPGKASRFNGPNTPVQIVDFRAGRARALECEALADLQAPAVHRREPLGARSPGRARPFYLTLALKPDARVATIVRMSPLQVIALIPAALLTYVAGAALFMHLTAPAAAGDWRTLSREPTGLAPDPATTREAIVQVYAARAMRWRGYFGVHPWIAVKRAGARQFTVYEVSGWHLRYGNSAVVRSHRAPDGRWFGNPPELLAERRGADVDALIDRIEAAVDDYPWKDQYRVWPGPNSNTFIAHVLRAAPELRVDLPPTALGKDWLGAKPFAKLPSGTGVQLNAFGVLGVAAGVEEGLEINLLGLTFGIDVRNLAVKLPLIGSVGPKGLRGTAQARPPLDVKE